MVSGKKSHHPILWYMELLWNYMIIYGDYMVIWCYMQLWLILFWNYWLVVMIDGYPLVMSTVCYWKWWFVRDLAIENGGSFHNYVAVYQRVSMNYQWLVLLTILKNDGVRQWEGWHPIYEMENNSHVWNHQPVMIDGYQWLLVVITNWCLLMVTNGDDWWILI